MSMLPPSLPLPLLPIFFLFFPFPRISYSNALREDYEKLARALNLFTGLHRFHNYTSSVKASMPQAVREIYSFTASEPFFINDMEAVSVIVHGRSFMLNQIRKLIGESFFPSFVGLCDLMQVPPAF